MGEYQMRHLGWVPFRTAFHNPIFRGGMAEFCRQSTRGSYGLNYLIVLCIVLFITWPKEGFLSLRDLPFTYNALGGSIVIILAYLNFSQGSHKAFGSKYVSVHDWFVLAPLRAGTFLRGYVAVGLVDLCFYWTLSLPLLILAASVSGESFAHLGIGLCIILVCVGSYRIMGVTLLTFLERDEFLLYILVRLCFVFFVLVSGFVVPLCNPVLAFADASIWPRTLGSIVLPGVTLQGWMATVVVHLLLAGLFFIIALIRVHWIQRHAAFSAGKEGGAESGNV
jgi:hypothetical protein